MDGADVYAIQGLAKSFVAAGAKAVVLVGRSLEALQSAIEDLKSDTTRVLPLSGSVTSQAAVDDIFKKVISEFGKVDVLVNAAGVMNVGPIGVLDSDKWWENFVGPSQISVHYRPIRFLKADV